MYNHHQSAFTLIEIMIVIAIIAILAGIMMPNVMRARQETNYQACKQNAEIIGKAIGMALIRYDDGYIKAKGDVGQFLVDSGYLKAMPACPIQEEGYAINYYDEPIDCGVLGWVVTCKGKHTLGNEELIPLFALNMGGDDHDHDHEEHHE